MSTIRDYKSQEKGSFQYELNDHNYPPSFKLANLNQNSTNVKLTQRQNTLEKINTQVEHCIGYLLLLVVFPPAPNCWVPAKQQRWRVCRVNKNLFLKQRRLFHNYNSRKLLTFSTMSVFTLFSRTSLKKS
jgi:hypothetical protein